jgi:hypothetical protein
MFELGFHGVMTLNNLSRTLDETPRRSRLLRRPP